MRVQREHQIRGGVYTARHAAARAALGAQEEVHADDLARNEAKHIRAEDEAGVLRILAAISRKPPEKRVLADDEGQPPKVDVRKLWLHD